MPRRTVTKFNAHEREQYRAAKHAEARNAIESATRALLTSDGWRRWAETRTAFHSYSWGNCALIAMQRPEATQVAGFRRWQELGRQVRKGERSIKIMAPMSVKREDDHGDDEVVTFFRAVPVFDIAQTDGDPLPQAPREPITGDSHAEHIPALEAHAQSLGYAVERRELPNGAGGYCDAQRHVIAISTSHTSANAVVRVLVHELAHAHGVGYRDYGRDGAEVIVETAAVIVCGALGLDTSGESIPYIAGWGEASDLAAIKTHAATVDEIATALEKAVGVKQAAPR
jgi:antirestriction protein ArdC